MKTKKSLVMLDLMSIKKQLSTLNLILLAIQVFAVAFFANSVWIAIVLGVFLGLMLNNSTFYYAEIGNTDTLYTILGLSRTIVVTNRYLSALTVCLGSIIFCLPFCVLGYFAALLAGFQHGVVFSPQIWVFFSIILLSSNVIQLPIYFKLGFSKAKFTALAVPFLLYLALVAVVSYIIFHSAKNGVSLKPLMNAFNSVGFRAVTVLVLVIVVLVSYRLSLKFYQKRDF
jgi:hypothetical protein